MGACYGGGIGMSWGCGPAATRHGWQGRGGGPTGASTGRFLFGYGRNAADGRVEGRPTARTRAVGQLTPSRQMEGTREWEQETACV